MTHPTPGTAGEPPAVPSLARVEDLVGGHLQRFAGRGAVDWQRQ